MHTLGFYLTLGLGFGVWLGVLATLGLAHTRSAPTSGNVPWGSPARRSRHVCGRYSSTLELTSAYGNIMAGLRRCYWRIMAGGM